MEEARSVSEGSASHPALTLTRGGELLTTPERPPLFVAHPGHGRQAHPAVPAGDHLTAYLPHRAARGPGALHLQRVVRARHGHGISPPGRTPCGRDTGPESRSKFGARSDSLTECCPRC